MPKIKGLRVKVPRQVPKAWKLINSFTPGIWGDGFSRPLTEEWLVYLDELAFLLASAKPYWEWLEAWSKTSQEGYAEIARQQFVLSRFPETMLRITNAWIMSQEYAFETSGVSAGWVQDGYRGNVRFRLQEK